MSYRTVEFTLDVTVMNEVNDETTRQLVFNALDKILQYGDIEGFDLQEKEVEEEKT